MNLLNLVSSMLKFFVDVVFNMFPITGQIRLGYANEAKIHSESTHQIPTNGFKLANANYVAIVDNIKKMLLQSVNKFILCSISCTSSVY